MGMERPVPPRGVWTGRRKEGQQQERTPGRMEGFFPIRRLGGIHLCLLKLFENPHLSGWKGSAADASPLGWGAILVKIEDGLHRKLFPIEAVECLISEDEANLLAVEYKESSSQAVMEAYAILRAIEERSSSGPTALWPWRCQRKWRHTCP